MRIIRQGHRPEHDMYQGECMHCKTVVEFRRSEATYVNDPRHGDFLSVKCPECQRMINVDVRAGKLHRDFI